MKSTSKTLQPRILKLIITYTYVMAILYLLYFLIAVFSPDSLFVDANADSNGALREQIATITVSIVLFSLSVWTIYLFRKRSSLAISAYIITAIASYGLIDLLNVPTDLTSVFEVGTALVFAAIDIAAVVYLLRSKDVSRYLKSE